MFRATIINIFENVWPMMLIVMTILISLRIAHVILNKTEVYLYKELLMLGFIIYIMCLFYVVTFQDVSWSTSNFVPFKEMFRYEFGSRMFIKNVAGNMLMFMPYGFFISYFLKLKKPSAIFLLSLIVSLTIETTQSLIGRVFDVDDIILNVLGAFIGFGIFYFLDRLRDSFPPILKKTWVYNIIITVIALIIVLTIAEILITGV